MPSRYEIADEAEARINDFFAANRANFPANLIQRLDSGERPIDIPKEANQTSDYYGVPALEDLSFEVADMKAKEEDRGFLVELGRLPIEHPLETATLLAGGVGAAYKVGRGGVYLARMAGAGRIKRGLAVGATDAAIQAPFSVAREVKAYDVAVAGRADPEVAYEQSAGIVKGEIIGAGVLSGGAEILGDWLVSAVTKRTLTERGAMAVEAGLMRNKVAAEETITALRNGDAEFVGSLVRGLGAAEGKALVRIDEEIAKELSKEAVERKGKAVYADFEKATETEIQLVMGAAGGSPVRQVQVATKQEVETGGIERQGIQRGRCRPCR